MTTLYIITTKKSNMTDHKERFVSKDEFTARAVLNLIIASEFAGNYDKKKHMETNTDEAFVDGWWFYSKDQHYSEGEWITLRRYEVKVDE